MTDSGLEGEPARCTVWRVGRRPEPWAWVDWDHSVNGRFPGRWDDPDGEYRTTYAGASLASCLAEVLAGLRPSAPLANEMDDIKEDQEDAETYPTAPPGALSYSWLETRVASQATLNGTYCKVTAMTSIAALRPTFLPLASAHQFTDFDAATLKDQRARPITQAVSKHVWSTGHFHGIKFSSRLGDDTALWVIFEWPEDQTVVSPQLSDLENHVLTPEDPEVQQIFSLFNLRWVA